MLAELVPLRLGHCTAPERLSRRTASWKPVRFPAGAVLIRHPKLGDLLFDTGYGSAFFTATERFPERLYRWLTPVRQTAEEHLPRRLVALGATPAMAILSHLHADHVAGLFDLTAIPPVLTSRRAWQHLKTGGRLATLKGGCPHGLRAQLLGQAPHFIEDLAACPSPKGLEAFGPCHDLIGDGSLLTVPLPGHGTGQFGLFLPQTAKGPAFLIADAAWSLRALRENAPPPISTLRRLGDAPAYLATFAALVALMRARPDITLWPSHCPETFA